MAGLRLYDMSDPEFMAVVRDTANADGWVSTLDLAKALGFPEDNFQSVVVRLSWMKRYGVITRDTKKKNEAGEKNETYALWRLTEIGNELIDAKFNKTQANAVLSATESQPWLVAQSLSDNYQRTDPVVAVLVRREMLLGFYKGRR